MIKRRTAWLRFLFCHKCDAVALQNTRFDDVACFLLHGTRLAGPRDEAEKHKELDPHPANERVGAKMHSVTVPHGPIPQYHATTSTCTGLYLTIYWHMSVSAQKHNAAVQAAENLGNSRSGNSMP